MASSPQILLVTRVACVGHGPPQPPPRSSPSTGSFLGCPDSVCHHGPDHPLMPTSPSERFVRPLGSGWPSQPLSLTDMLWGGLSLALLCGMAGLGLDAQMPFYEMPGTALGCLLVKQNPGLSRPPRVTKSLREDPLP